MRQPIVATLVLFLISAHSGATKHILHLRETSAFSGEQSTSVQRSAKAERGINVTYPGTKWCGPGSIAKNYEDLGTSREEDICCRAHDHCDNIPAGESKNGLTNTDFFTRLHCECDRAFYDCLHNLDSTTGNRIGQMYFGVRSVCYKEDYPIVNCAEYAVKYFVRRCIRYNVNDRLGKQYQWFDIPMYYGKGFGKSPINYVDGNEIDDEEYFYY